MIAAAFLALCWFVHNRAARIETQIDEKIASLGAKLEDAAKQSGERQQEMINRIERLEQTLADIKQSQPEAIAGVPLAALHKHAALIEAKPGLYVLDKKIRMENTSRNGYYDGDFTIYHIKAALSSDSGEINIGLAIGDLTTPPAFYIDYNHDGKVDAEMMRDFASIGPLGPLMRRGINEKNSQAAYDAFLSGYSSASYTSLEMVENSGESIASSLWGFVKDQSSEMLKWITAHDPTSLLSGGASAPAATSDGEPTPQ